MIVANKKWVALGFCLLLQSCGQVDDYLLGKDNTPKPTALAAISPKMNLVENWSVPIGKSSKSRMYLKLKPMIHDNVVYTADAGGMVQAIDKSSGKALWANQLKQGLISGPAVAEGYIALGTNTASIVLLNQSNGHEVWQAKVSGDALSKPVIASHKVIAKTIDGNLYAFDLKTGEKLWGANHGAPGLILKASSSPVIVDKLALVGFSDGKLDAIDLQS